MIEIIVLSYIQRMTDISTFLEEPERPPEKYVIVEKVGSTYANRFDGAVIAVQSYAPTLLEAAELSRAIKQHMHRLPELVEAVTHCSCTGDYNYTDTQTHRYRYQAVYSINYYEE